MFLRCINNVNNFHRFSMKTKRINCSGFRIQRGVFLKRNRYRHFSAVFKIVVNKKSTRTRKYCYNIIRLKTTIFFGFQNSWI